MSGTINLKVIIFSIVLGVLSMLLIIFYSMHRQEVMAANEQAQISVANRQPSLDGKFEEIYTDKGTEESFCIPVTDGYFESDLQCINDYVNRRFLIRLERLPKDYFKTNMLYGDISHIEDIVCYYELGTTYLYIYMDSVYECEYTLEEGKLSLAFVEPHEKYDQIVVLDAGHGGEDEGNVFMQTKEKDITLDVVLRLQKMLEARNIKVYYTRTTDVNVSQDKRVMLANAVKADMFLSIHCGADEMDSGKYGITTFYNDTYFIPYFGNLDFAYEVEEKVSQNAPAKALGLEAGEEFIQLLENSTVPTAYTEIGYLTNERENLLLNEEEYRERIAKGLEEAILNSYRLLEE